MTKEEQYVTISDFRVGAKVRRGPDWDWEDQDKGSDYGILQGDDLDTNGGVEYAMVNWYNKSGDYILQNRYRVSTGIHDLVYLETEIERFEVAINELIKKLDDGRN